MRFLAGVRVTKAASLMMVSATPVDCQTKKSCQYLSPGAIECCEPRRPEVLFPLPPLDGGRIAVGVLPDAVASPLARLEPYGMLILIGLLFILPTLGVQTGVDVNIVWRFIARSTDAIIDAILRLTGNY